jgi:hypothetical protein
MRRSLLVTLAVFGLVGSAAAAPPPKVASAADGIFAAFESHPLVGLGEWHGLAQEYDFYPTLLRDPRFAREVGNVVLEVGDAAQQSVIDRYVAGEDVPYMELRKVWADTVGWFPTVTAIGSINLYATIREVNRTLPPEGRIKVWLGDPPIDWTQIKDKAAWEALEKQKQRDAYPAGLVEREILAMGKKALMIYGVGHFGIYPGYDNIRALLDKDHPGALFTVSPYVGYGQKDCAARFERHIRKWPVPSLVSPIRGSTLEKDIFRKSCNAFPQGNIPDAGFEMSGRNNLGLNSDALLYLGPRAGLLKGPADPDIYLDAEYRAEMDRRMVLRTGQHLNGSGPSGNPSVPMTFFDPVTQASR